MPKYTVYLLTPYAIYEDVMAKNQKEACSKVELPQELDLSEPCKLLAIEEI